MGRSKIYDYSKEDLQDLLDTSNGYADVLRNMGLNPKGGNPKTLKRVIAEYNLDTTKLDKNRSLYFSETGIQLINKQRYRDTVDILQKNVSYPSSKLLHRLYKEGLKEKRCERCKITEWEGEPISFHLHHKDGDRLNNELENLQVLCPNCHSLTENFAGKATKKATKKTTKKADSEKKKYFCIDCGEEISSSGKRCVKCAGKYKQNAEMKELTREKLKDLIRTTPFTIIGKQFGVSDNAIRKHCKKFNLPYKSKEIKQFLDKEWEKI